MANTLRIKRRASGASGAPTTSQCVNAELAFNEVDGILYYGKGGDSSASSSVIAIGAELGTGVAAFLKTPSSANLATALTDETGSSTVVFSNSPTLVTPDIGTPSAGTLTNCTGLPIGTGVSGLGTGVATFLATPSSANLRSAVTDETGSGSLVFATSPTLVTPALGTPSSGTLTNCTGLPIGTGVSDLGTGVATFLTTPSSANLYAALTDETGSALGSPVVVFSVNPTITNSLRVDTGVITYSKLNGNGLTTYNYSNDAVRGYLNYQMVGQYVPVGGWTFSAGSGNGINFVDTYGAAATPIRWVPATGVAGESAIWTSLSPATLPATYAAHPAGESGYGKLAYNLKLPANSGELATTSYVASAIAAATGTATSLKQAVAVATTANITLSGLQTIDGYTTVDGDRVLVKNQTSGPANGIYVAVSGSWARATDADTAGEISGASVFVQNGTANGSKTFTCTTSNITLGTTALTFSDTSTIGIAAGDGLTQTGSIIDVVGTADRITANANSIDIASTYVGQNTITTLGTITTGTWTGTTIGALYGGTGFSTYSSGDLVYASATNTLSKLAKAGSGTTGVLIQNGTTGIMSWAGTTGTTTSNVVFSTSPTFETSVVGSTNFDVFNTTSTTINAFGAATTANIGYTGAATSTTNISTGASGALTTKTINIGTGSATGGGTVVNIGSATAGANSTTTVNKDLVVTGNLTVNGTTTTLNSATLLVDDKNIELGSVESATISTTGTVSTISGSGPWTAIIQGMTSTTGLIVGSSLAATSGTGTLFGGSPTSVVVTSVGSTSVIYQVTGGTAPTTGTITNITTTGATNTTADGGGITLKGATDKTLNWVNATSAWTSSEDFNLLTGKVYEIAGTTVLSATTLGSDVVNSSLTSVGTIGTGTWQGTAVGPVYGGTGQTSYATGDLIYASDANTLSKLTKPASTTSILQMTSAGVPSWVDPCTAVANCTLDGGNF